jgi:hypothetical protein
MLSFAVPQRLAVRWDLEVQFGNADGTNDWAFTTAWASPVLFWQIHTLNQSNPPLAMNIDTDSNDATKLMLTVFQRVLAQPSPVQIGTVHGLPRHAMAQISVQAFLDERDTAAGGQGRLQIWVNGALIMDRTGATISVGTHPHWWDIDTYLWNEPAPYAHTRATFWKTARMYLV